MRLKNIVRNSFFSVLSQVILIAVGFFSQRVMNLQLGKELIGMNGVIANVIAILSVSELGISTAVVYHLYRALAQKDEEMIAALMNLYRRAYHIFAAALTALGLAVMPFVHLFLKENTFPLSYVRLIFCLWLARTVLTYLLSYRRSILIADQREYLVSIVTLVMNVLNYLSVIVILMTGGSYVLALGTNIVIEVVLNAGLSWYVGRAYPFLRMRRDNVLPKEMVRRVVKDVKNIFVTRICAKLLYSTDNLIISGFISVGIVGLYSNYCLITQSVSNVLLALSGAIQPSVGNLFTEGDYEKDYRALRQITFLFFLLAVCSASCLLGLMTPFVSDFWLGKAFALEESVVVWCSVNCFVQTLGMPLSMVLGVSGLFGRERSLSILSTGANLVLSLWLVHSYGIVGVMMGTFCAYCIQIAFRVRVFFRDYLSMRSGRYVIELLEYVALAAIELCIVSAASGWIYGPGGQLRFVLAMAFCALAPLGGNLAIFGRSERLGSMIGLIRHVAGRQEHHVSG